MHLPINANKNVHKITILNISLYSNVCHSHIQQELQKTDVQKNLFSCLLIIRQCKTNSHTHKPGSTSDHKNFNKGIAFEFQIDTFANIVSIKFKTWSGTQLRHYIFWLFWHRFTVFTMYVPGVASGYAGSISAEGAVKIFLLMGPGLILLRHCLWLF